MKRALSFLLAVMIVATVVCVPVHAEQGEKAYGSIPILIGYPEVDYLAEQVLAQLPLEGKNTREKIQIVYDWIILNFERYEEDWDGQYHFDQEEVARQAELYAQEANKLLEEGKAVIRPEWISYYGVDTEDTRYDSNSYIANRAYTILYQHLGDCTHFASLLAVLLGHLGLDCRLIPGEYINTSSNTYIRHKWNCVLVDGQYYWLDVRIDHSIYKSNGSIYHQLFMKPDTNAWARNHSWDHTYSDFLWEHAAEISHWYTTVGHTHEFVKTEAKEPTCTESGCVEHYTCTICKGCYLDPEGNDWVSAGYVTRPALGHDWGEWVVTKESTYEEAGSRERVCRRDSSHVEKETLNILGNHFEDVTEDDYFYNPVVWASNNNITSGVTPTRFGPNNSCTRAQIVTFLWAANGKPEPNSTGSSFKDVTASDYYYKAVLWAVENGITSGVTSNRFGANDSCTRAQAVTFLWAAKGRPEPVNTENSFTDVKESDYYYDAVLWAVENNITSGVGVGRFGPKNTCTRAQIVTFLYKAYAE